MKWIGINSTSDTSLADITSVVAGTGLSGGGTTGDVTLNVDASQTQITELGTIAAGGWRGARIESAYLDTDTAHLTTTQVFTGDKTFSTKLTVLDSTASSATQGGKLNLISNDGAALGDDHRLGVVQFIAAEDASDGYVAGAKIQAMADAAWSASENGTRLEFYTTDGNASQELSLTLDSDLLATFTGAVTVTGALTGTLATVSQPNITGVGTIGTGVWNGDAIAQAYIAGDAINGDKIADDAIDSEHYTDGSIDTAHIADDQVTFAKAIGVSPSVYGSTIKLIPSDFLANDDGGNTKFGIGFVESAGGLYGMRAANNDTELYAFVSIPEGMKATAVVIHAKSTLAVAVFEAQINATTMAVLETGSCNTGFTITDTNSTATNFLVIQVTTTSATNSKVYGGSVTIAPQ
jgi:hypothetical protein